MCLCTIFSNAAFAETVTVGGYTAQQLESTYYLDRDLGTAYPTVDEVFSAQNIADASEIESKLLQIEHPGVIAKKDDFERVGRLVKTDSYIAKWYAEIEIQGDKYIRTAAT